MIDNQTSLDAPGELNPDLADLSIRTVLRFDALANAVRNVIEDLDAETFAAFGNAPGWSGVDGSGRRRLDVALGAATQTGVESLRVVGPEEFRERADG